MPKESTNVNKGQHSQMTQDIAARLANYPDPLTLRQVQELTGFSFRRLKRAMQRGALRAHRGTDRGWWMVAREEVRLYLEGADGGSQPCRTNSVTATNA